MANSQVIVPFIIKAEGGWVNNPNDKGGETNKGITLAVWQSVFGMFSHDRFMAMAQEDWYTIFKQLYWDKIFGDRINSQRIANLLGDWIWGSGQFYSEKDTQEVLNSIGGHLTTDGVFGPETIMAINAADENTLYNDLIARRQEFIESIVEYNPSQEVFKQGWLNRLNNLVQFNTTIAA